MKQAFLGFISKEFTGKIVTQATWDLGKDKGFPKGRASMPWPNRPRGATTGRKTQLAPGILLIQALDECAWLQYDDIGHLRAGGAASA